MALFKKNLSVHPLGRKCGESRMLSKRLPKYRGSALLTALFIMTLIAIVATAMSTKLQFDIYRTRLVINHDKLYLASQVVTFWSLNQLNEKNFAFNDNSTYPKKLQFIYNQVQLSGELHDLQAYFNLNNLIDKKSFPIFINLLSHTFPHIKREERISLAMALIDWLSPYDLARGKDAYLTYYSTRKPPYYSSHQLMTSSSELRLIKGINTPLYLSLSPSITVLPESTPININTAPRTVLMSLGNGLTENQTDELIIARGKKGIKKLNEIAPLLQKLDIPTDQLTLESNYYLSIARASNEDFTLIVYTLIKRTKEKNGKLTVNIIRQSFNAF